MSTRRDSPELLAAAKLLCFRLVEAALAHGARWLGCGAGTMRGRMQKAAKLLLKEDGWHVRYPGPNGQRYLVPLHTHDYDEAYERTNVLLRDRTVEWIIC